MSQEKRRAIIAQMVEEEVAEKVRGEVESKKGGVPAMTVIREDEPEDIVAAPEIPDEEDEVEEPEPESEVAEEDRPAIKVFKDGADTPPGEDEEAPSDIVEKALASGSDEPSEALEPFVSAAEADELDNPETDGTWPVRRPARSLRPDKKKKKRGDEAAKTTEHMGDGRHVVTEKSREIMPQKAVLKVTGKIIEFDAASTHEARLFVGMAAALGAELVYRRRGRSSRKLHAVFQSDDLSETLHRHFLDQLNDLRQRSEKRVKKRIEAYREIIEAERNGTIDELLKRRGIKVD